MSRFITITTDNISWALNRNLQIAYEAIATMLPIQGAVRLEGDLDGGNTGSNGFALQKVKNYGANSAFTQSNAQGTLEQGILNQDAVSQAVVNHAELASPGILQTYYSTYFLPNCLAGILQPIDGASNIGTAGGSVSLLGTPWIMRGQIPSYSVPGGTTFTPTWNLWEPQSNNNLLLNTITDISANTSFSISYWAAVQRVAQFSDGSWAHGQFVAGRTGPSQWLSYWFEDVGGRLMYADTTYPSGALVNWAQPNADGVAGENFDARGPNYDGPIWTPNNITPANLVPDVHFIVHRYDAGTGLITTYDNLRKVQVRVYSAPATNPPAPSVTQGLQITQTSTTNQWRNTLIGSIKLWGPGFNAFGDLGPSILYATRN